MANMDIEARIYDVLSAGVSRRTYPGAVVGYIHDGEQRILPFGRLTYDEDSRVVTADTLYDLASVTKSIPTASIILRLAEQGKLSLDDPIEKFVPEMAGTSSGRILIRHLLTFTTVFDLKEPLSTVAAKGREAVLHTIFTTPLRYLSGGHFYYSDAPYILLGAAAEIAAKKPLDRIADELFFVPLGMRHTTFHPEALTNIDIAPTEITTQGLIHGQAHDEKAHAFAREGKVTGHAGLFSTAGDLLCFCRMILNGGELDGKRYLTHAVIRQMREEAVVDGAYSVSLAWRTKHPGFLRSNLAGRVIGKEGYTGGVVLLEPAMKRCLVLLTNRTYPERPKTSVAIQETRRSLEDILFADQHKLTFPGTLYSIVVYERNYRRQ